MHGELQFLHEAEVGSSGVGLVVSVFLIFGQETAPFLRTTIQALRGYVGTSVGGEYQPPQYHTDIKVPFESDQKCTMREVELTPSSLWHFVSSYL